MSAYNTHQRYDLLLWLGLATFLATALSCPAQAQDRYDATKRPTCETGKPQQVWLLNESSATDCDTTAGGSTPALCCCDGDASPAWAACSSAGASSNSFATIDAPSGTDPVADSSSDTLQLLSGAAALSVTGSSLADSVTFDIAGTASKCARFDGSGELVAASGDCSAGDTTGGAITLDIGDDGGNDSTALAEIATSGDDHGAVTEPTADKAMIDFAKIPPFQQYDPDRPPASAGTGGLLEDWTGDAEALTWTWGNQDTATQTVEFDGTFIDGITTGDEGRGRYIDAPANADQTFTAKILVLDTVGGFTAACGLSVVSAGTRDSPTAISLIMSGDYATDALSFFSDTNSDFAAGVTTHGSANTYYSIHYYKWATWCAQLRYTDSTRDLQAWWAIDCKSWFQVGAATTLAADPLYWGITVRDDAICRFEWARLRTDANRNQASD